MFLASRCYRRRRRGRSLLQADHSIGHERLEHEEGDERAAVHQLAPNLAYFVDYAGKEFYKARRYGRHFALMVISFDNLADVRRSAGAETASRASGQTRSGGPDASPSPCCGWAERAAGSKTTR